MRAAVLESYGDPIAIREVDRPAVAPNGALVAVEACGVCRSDWHAWRGHGEWADDQVPLGQVLGHEPAGTVVEVGAEVTDVAVGERVVVPFDLGDGTCQHCRSGHGNVCPDGHALGFEADAPGAFAEYVHVPRAEFNLAALPDAVPAVAAAALGCRFATAFNALRVRADVATDDRLAVFGCGGLGLSAVQIGAALGATVVGVDVRAEPLDVATAQGAVGTVDATSVDDVPGAVRAALGGPADVTLDALGSAETCQQGVASLGPRGTHVQAGLTGEAERGSIELPTDEMTRWERSFLGARGMPPGRYGELLAMVADGALDPGALVTRELSLDEVPERLEAMDDYGTTGVEVVTTFA